MNQKLLQDSRSVFSLGHHLNKLLRFQAVYAQVIVTGVAAPPRRPLRVEGIYPAFADLCSLYAVAAPGVVVLGRMLLQLVLVTPTLFTGTQLDALYQGCR